jgi:NADH dehydrogenase (ubiquinone) 1 alpha subcomplex subunit 13
MEKNLGPIVQDMPPKGGYPKLEFKRGIGNRGPSGFAIWGAVIGCTVWGFYKVGWSFQGVVLLLFN